MTTTATRRKLTAVAVIWMVIVAVLAIMAGQWLLAVCSGLLAVYGVLRIF